MNSKNFIVCSFHTPDDYYRSHADALRRKLDSLEIDHEITQISLSDNRDWAHITRKKISTIHDACNKYPEKMVIWIDVDCSISHLPDYIVNSSADLLAFQRSFGSPLQIGYHNRTRFWEPCFLAINTSPQARKFIKDALELEQRSDLRATDDYFIEESWRANSSNLTFQIIPGSASFKKRRAQQPMQRQAFFFFGSSGNVSEFKHKVVQHGAKASTKRTKTYRSKLLKLAKYIEKVLPQKPRNRLRKISDAFGITGFLVARPSTKTSGVTQRTSDKLLQWIFAKGLKGDKSGLTELEDRYNNQFVANYAAQSKIEASKALVEYSDRGDDKSIPLMWWSKPFPGNFGDWLSPMIIANYTSANIKWVPPTTPYAQRHIVALGSIGRFIKSSSIVLGTGVSTDDLVLNSSANYISVRGPITADVLMASGGKRVTAFGDIGLAISEIVCISRSATNGRIALVRHYTDAGIPLQLPDTIDEISIMMSRPENIVKFLETLNKYDKVLTSALHVMIACQSYGIPCGLVNFNGYQDNVHGSGIKYADYALGAGVEIINPITVELDLRTHDVDNLVRDVKVDLDKKVEVIEHVRSALQLIEQ